MITLLPHPLIFTQVFLAIVLVLYLASLLFILVYSLTQGSLTYIFLKQRNTTKISNNFKENEWPLVTVQLPVYNERYVVERLLNAVAKLDYPASKLQIQLLDDSTDDTTSIAAKCIANWKAAGIDMVHLTRTDRQGYKAGALKEGLKTASGEFIAIFDADFVPYPDFLKKTIVAFTNPKIGMVQSRWAHLNRDQSLLTKAQAFTIDAHFLIEQNGRNGSGSFINFNGTAGVWRASCIADAGNWQADTLTEDLDLSYRAQIKGWQFVYLNDTTAPAELPPVMSAVKSQQYRWNKGGAETAIKLWPGLVKSKLPFKVKWYGSFHLLSSTVFIAVFLSALCSVPMLYFKQIFPQYAGLYHLFSIFLISFLIVAWIYFLVSKDQHGGKPGLWWTFLKEFPIYLSFSMGMSLHNALAVAEGFAGRKTPFIRTPKFNTNSNSNIYLKQNLNLISILELVMTFYFLFGIGYAFVKMDFTMLPFHIMLALGFGMVSYYSIFYTGIKKRPSAA